MKSMSARLCRRWVLFMLAVLLIGCSVAASSAAADSSPKALVARFDDQLLATMKNAEALGFAGRYRKLAPVIDRNFDLARIAKLALGGEWNTLDAAQQQAYLAKFRKDTIATYASRFDGYDGQRFEITGSTEAPGGRRRVTTEIVAGDGTRTSVDYVLTDSGDGWRIVNVVARGVSDLALKRGQYTSAIRSKGAAGFLEQFDRQLDKYPALPD